MSTTRVYYVLFLINELSKIVCTVCSLCGSGFCTVPCHFSFCRKPTSAYLAKSSNGHHTAGVAASLLLSITTNGTRFGGVQYILASASGYNISSFAVFLSDRTSGRHCLLSVVVLLVIYSRRWRSLGAAPGSIQGLCTSVSLSPAFYAIILSFG